MKLIIWDFKNTIYNWKLEDLYPTALELIKKYRKAGFNQVLVSTAVSPKQREELIKSLGLWNKFDEVMLVGFKTPNLFRSICKRNDCKPDETYVVGDNLHSEIRTGSKLNMKTIYIEHKKVPWWKRFLLGDTYWRKVGNLEEAGQVIGK